jgi:hypothetical protein
LLNYGINDVDVEIRQSKVIQSAGPQLFQPIDPVDPTVDVRMPFTATLGITICARLTPWTEGTAGFFLDEGGDGKRLLLATARHVVLPQSENKLYECKPESQDRHDVLVLSEASFQQHLVFIKDQIKAQEVAINYHTKRIEKMVDREECIAIRTRKDAQNMVQRAEEKAKTLTDFHRELSTHWATDMSRILDHVIFSPPIDVGVGTEKYTQDVAVIDIDTSKMDLDSFAGNVIDLGTKLGPEKLITAIVMMHPNPKNSHNFDYPGDRLLSLRGTISDKEMRKRQANHV